MKPDNRFHETAIAALNITEEILQKICSYSLFRFKIKPDIFPLTNDYPRS